MPQIRAFTGGHGRLPPGLPFSADTLPTDAAPFVDLMVGGRRSGHRQSLTEHRRRPPKHRRIVRSCCKGPRAQQCVAIASRMVVAIVVAAAIVVIIIFELRHNRHGQLPASGAPASKAKRATSSANLQQLESMEAALHGAQVDLISHEKRLRATVDGGA